MAKKVDEKNEKNVKSAKQDKAAAKASEKALPFDVQRVVSERSFAQADSQGKYTFYVPVDKNKIEIASVVEAKYKVKVEGVNVVTIRGKSKVNWKNRKIKRYSDRKKAVVTLAKGDKIEDFTKIS